MEERDKISRIIPKDSNSAISSPQETILIPKIGETKKETKVESTPSQSTAKKYPKGPFILIGFLAFLFLYLGIATFNLYKKGTGVYQVTQKIKSEVQNQNLEGIKTGLANLESSLKSFKKATKLLIPFKFIPYIGDYYKDLEHTTIASFYLVDTAKTLTQTLEPYADIIGFGESSNKQAQDGAATTQERIDFLVASIPSFVAKADEISQKMALAQKEIDAINPDRYPEKIGKREVRNQIKNGIEAFDVAVNYIVAGKPLLASLPSLLGIDSPKTYLVIFQNDKELRPTGGFITAYAIMKVTKAKVEPVSSNDIYNLDSNYKPTITAPEPIVKYLKGPYIASPKLRLRDMNWSPDFEESMKLFSDEIQKVGIKNIDGIVGVDTQLLVYLLDVIGPIGVSGYGNFSTQIVPECNCPQVIYELESFADVEGPIVWSENVPGKIVYAPANYENRKKIIGPLMNSILANAMGQPKEKLPALFQAGFKSLEEKHVLLYMFDESLEKAINDFHIGGKIESSNGDYLHINDANLGGRKSNLYITQEVNQEIRKAKDGTIEKTLTITYKNPAPYDGWLNSVLPNWVRVYVPTGSELISSEGLEEKTSPYEEFGKTVFAGYFKLRPQGVAKVVFTYKLSNKVKGDYELFIQKQPGTANPLYTLKMGKVEEEFYLRSDKIIKLRK